MNLYKILVILGGLGLVSFIYWFFFGKKPSFVKSNLTMEGQGRIDVIVDGGYRPENIKIRKGQKTTISFLRKDSNTCLEEVIISEFKVNKYLPMNEKVEVEIIPKTSGEFSMHCGMNMFHGKIIVE